MAGIAGGLLPLATTPIFNPLKPPNPFKPKEIFATTPLGRYLDKKKDNKSQDANATNATTKGTALSSSPSKQGVL